MQSLVWASSKAQLWHVEAAYVKERVGRERIRRNKDTLRELQCYQEILADLQQGRCGPDALRRANEDAAGRWKALHKAAASRGVPPERLCPDAEPRVVRFLRARGVFHNESAGGSGDALGSEAAVSTRCPSTVQDMDARSTATDLRSEFAAETQEGQQRTGRGQRMAHGQLDRLAAALQGSLDEECTALLAAIEEVQSLMEAELQGRIGEPTQAELEAFVVAADAALKVAESDSWKSSRDFPWTYTYFFGGGKDAGNDEISALQTHATLTYGRREEEDSNHHSEREKVVSPPSPARKNGIQRFELAAVQELEGNHSGSERDHEPQKNNANRYEQMDQKEPSLCHAPSSAGSEPRAFPQSLRWADMSDSEDAEPSPVSTASSTVRVDRTSDQSIFLEASPVGWDKNLHEKQDVAEVIVSDLYSTPAERNASCASSQISSEKPQEAELGAQPGCHACGTTNRQGFSRRNWKRLRAGVESEGGTTDKKIVFCLACTGTTC